MIGFSAISMRNIFLKNQRTIKIRLYIMEAGGSPHYLNSFPSIRPETFPAARRAMRRAMRPFLIAFTSPNILAIRYSQLRVLLMLIRIYLIAQKQTYHNPFWIRCKVKKINRMRPALRVFKIQSRKIPPQNELGKKTEVRNSPPRGLPRRKNNSSIGVKADRKSRVSRMI